MGCKKENCMESVGELYVRTASSCMFFVRMRKDAEERAMHTRPFLPRHNQHQRQTIPSGNSPPTAFTAGILFDIDMYPPRKEISSQDGGGCYLTLSARF